MELSEFADNINEVDREKPNQKKYQSNIKSTEKSPNQIFSFYI